MTESAFSAPLRIATRESRLALWQANHVAELLRARHPAADVALLGMTTRGDQILDRPLAEIGGKGLFTKKLEVALFDGRAELAVHSLKDVPMDLFEGFDLAAVMTRADARDAFVSTRYASLDELPPDAMVKVIICIFRDSNSFDIFEFIIFGIRDLISNYEIGRASCRERV